MTGSIVSANPIIRWDADRYRTWGLGPGAGRQYGSRRTGAATKYSVFAPPDLPICASDPLAMASWGVNRITESGRVAAPEQRISVHDALRAITTRARTRGGVNMISAQSQSESRRISPCSKTTPMTLTRLISQGFVRGTVFRGRWHPVPNDHADRRVRGHRGADVVNLFDNATTSSTVTCAAAKLLNISPKYLSG